MHTQKGNFSFVIGILICVLMVGVGVLIYALISSRQTKEVATPPVSSSPPTASTSEWETYKNAEFGFEIQHPQNSTINLNDGKYIRIQNYTDQEINQNMGKLLPGQYYLEIIVSEPKACEAELTNPQVLKIGEVEGYQGEDRGGGDSAVVKPALCFNKLNTNYYLRASESQQLVTKKMLDSFKFTN